MLSTPAGEAHYDYLRPDYDILAGLPELPKLVCRIHKLRDPRLYRWPVCLEVIEPAWLRDYVEPLEEHQPRAVVMREDLSGIDIFERTR